MLNRTLLLSVFALALTACGPSTDGNGAATTTEPVRSDIPAAPAPASTTAGPQYLTLEESAVDLCKHPKGLMATQVSWDATAVPAEMIELWLENPGEPRKLWAATISKGTERTGEWLRNGSKVILVNKADSAVIQEITITEKACAGG